MEDLFIDFYERFGVGGAGALLLFLVGYGVAIRAYNAWLTRATRPGSLARMRGQTWEFRASIGLLGIPVVTYLAVTTGTSAQLFWAVAVFALYGWVGARVWVSFIQPGTAAPRKTAIYFCLGSQAYWILSFAGFSAWRDGWSAGLGWFLTSMLAFLALMTLVFTIELRKHAAGTTHAADAGTAETGTG